MAEVTYRGLPEFGLPLIARGDLSFDALVSEIESHPGPFPTLPSAVSDRAAVLLNQTGRAILAIECFWRYTGRDGKAQRTSQFSNLGSSVQRGALMGRSTVVRDIGTFVLPGSKRLIAANGIFGNNLDVLTPEELAGIRGYCGGWAGCGPRENRETELAAMELVLDLAILEDGLCVGPDESGLYEALNESFDVQCTAAEEAVRAFKAGAPVGRVFEIVRPLARHSPPPPGKSRHELPMLAAFGLEAIHHLTHVDGPDLLAYFERAAAPRSLELRRPR